jgi:hypothetical protein
MRVGAFASKTIIDYYTRKVVFCQVMGMCIKILLYNEKSQQTLDVRWLVMATLW